MNPNVIYSSQRRNNNEKIFQSDQYYKNDFSLVNNQQESRSYQSNNEQYTKNRPSEFSKR